MACGVKMRKVMDRPKTTQEGLVDDLKAARTTATKNITGKTLCCNAHKVFLLKKHICRPALSLPVNMSIIQRRLGRKVR